MLTSFYTVLGLSALAMARPSQYLFDEGRNVAPWKSGSNSIHIIVDAVDDLINDNYQDKPIHDLKLGFEDMDKELRVLASRANEVQALAADLHLYNHMQFVPVLVHKVKQTADDILQSARQINGSSVVKNEDKASELVEAFMEIAATAGNVGRILMPKLGYVRLMREQAEEMAKGLEMYKESIKALGKAFAPSVPDETENIKHAYVYVRDMYKHICGILKGEEMIWA